MVALYFYGNSGKLSTFALSGVNQIISHEAIRSSGQVSQPTYHRHKTAAKAAGQAEEGFFAFPA
jgi:hypothetical protein